MQVDSLVWLRRDLRTYDNKPWYLALNNNGKICPVFIFDKTILEQFPDPYDKRLSFIASSLELMNKELSTRHGEILILYGKSEVIIPQICKILGVKSVFAGRDFEPYSIARDNLVTKDLKQLGIILNLSTDHLLIDPERIKKPNGSPYQVFTHYAKAWRQELTQLDYHNYVLDDFARYADIQNIKIILNNLGIKALPCNAKHMLNDIGYIYQEDSMWNPDNGHKQLSIFVKEHIDTYTVKRNFLFLDGTSKLSPFLRFGLISIRDVYRSVNLHPNSSSWINELVWREFFAMILYYFPEIIKQEFKKEYRTLEWNQDLELFTKFIEGRTGFPIIDAAMRQLTKEGWMHNRARMIVACFMTKNLWLDWRLGEQHFAKYLMDYELASNVGGWQWSASTGLDSMPYFRMFNPYLQSKKFDSEGHYIKKYIDELHDLEGHDIHKPLPSQIVQYKYSNPVVDFNLTRKLAINNFKAIVNSKNT